MAQKDMQIRGIREISRAAYRAKDLVGQLLAYSRRQMLEVKSLDVNQALKNLSKMLKSLIREEIRLEFRLPPI